MGQSRGDTTEFDGRFVIGRLAPGAYRVRASYPGYALAKPQTVTVAAGQRTFVRIRLNREEIPPILLRK